MIETAVIASVHTVLGSETGKVSKDCIDKRIINRLSSFTSIHDKVLESISIVC